MQVHKDMIIAEVIEKIPKAAEIMAKHGLHCVGCSVNVFETIEMGAKGHGLTDEEIQSIIEEKGIIHENMGGCRCMPRGG